MGNAFRNTVAIGVTNPVTGDPDRAADVGRLRSSMDRIAHDYRAAGFDAGCLRHFGHENLEGATGPEPVTTEVAAF